MSAAPSDLLDVVVVGGGIAGLSAAWRLRHRRILLLEADERFGGRLHSQMRGDYWLNWGAHLFPGPGTLVGSMVQELGLQTVPVTGSMMGLAVGAKTITRGRVETYPLRLPFSPRERAEFAWAGLKVRRATARYQELAQTAPGDSPASVRSRVLRFLDSTTFEQFLGRLQPQVKAIFSCASHRATAELDQLSAGCGIGLFALVWAGRGSLIARNLEGGPGELPATVARRLGDNARCSVRVTSITLEGPQVVVEHHHRGQIERVRSRCAIVAVPPPQAAPLLREVDPCAANALSRLTYGPFVSLAIATNERGPMPWDDVYAMATPGRSFDLFTNQAHVHRANRARRPGGSLMLFAGGAGAAALAKESNEFIATRYLTDLYSLYPESRGIVEDAKVHRWALGNVFASPGRALLQTHLEGPLGRNQNVHLAGDYFSVLGNMEAAAGSGREAADRVEIALG